MQIDKQNILVYYTKPVALHIMKIPDLSESFSKTFFKE